jgi:hypothetical protein
VKFSAPTDTEAAPPTNATERTPPNTDPFVGHTPKIETDSPGETVPGSTIN